MKKIFTILVFVLATGGLRAQDIPARPNPPRLVNDFASVMTGEQRDDLESKLVAYDDSTSVQVVVVTVKSVGDGDIAEYALKIMRDWGVGNKKTNNGVAIVAAIDDHKVYIATGYGMEGAIPDVTAKSIIENSIVPNFKAGNFYRGFDAATDDIMKAAAGEYKAPKGYADRGDHGNLPGNVIGLLILVVVVLVIIARRGGGGGGGGTLSRTGFLPWMIASMLSDSGGRGGWSGGGGGGGFGGFGGGSGGGGGAGGSW